MVSNSTRRHDIDFIRVSVFGLLIIYHVSLIYGTKGFLVKSVTSNAIFDIIATASHPWRMSLLFFISGMATASLISRHSAEGTRAARSRQLIPPLLFGMLFLIPPQEYAGALTRGWIDMSYGEFWWTYLRNGHFVDKAGVEHWIFEFQHLWFLVYLWIYTAILTSLKSAAPSLLEAIAARLTMALRGKGLLLWPILYLAVLRLTLFPIFGETLELMTDWYDHIVFLSFFIGGTLLLTQERFWTELVEQRLLTVEIAVGCFVILAAVSLVIPHENRAATLVFFVRVVRSAFQWSAILAIFAFARLRIQKPHPALTYLNRGILTYYLVHQTVIVLAALWLRQLGLLQPWSFFPILIVTFIACGASFEIWRRVLKFRSDLSLRPSGTVG